MGWAVGEWGACPPGLGQGLQIARGQLTVTPQVAQLGRLLLQDPKQLGLPVPRLGLRCDDSGLSPGSPLWLCAFASRTSFSTTLLQKPPNGSCPPGGGVHIGSPLVQSQISATSLQNQMHLIFIQIYYFFFNLHPS